MSITCVLFAGAFWIRTAHDDYIAVEHIIAITRHSLTSAYVITDDRRIYVPHSVARVRQTMSRCR